MIPEFIGRLPIVVTLDALDELALRRILTEPRNALVRQFQKIMSMDGVELTFTKEALVAIAIKAQGRKTGARGLRSILEEDMLEVMYDLPSLQGVKKCIVNKEVDREERAADAHLSRAEGHARLTEPPSQAVLATVRNAGTTDGPAEAVRPKSVEPRLYAWWERSGFDEEG